MSRVLRVILSSPHAPRAPGSLLRATRIAASQSRARATATEVGRSARPSKASYRATSPRSIRRAAGARCAFGSSCSRMACAATWAWACARSRCCIHEDAGSAAGDSDGTGIGLTAFTLEPGGQ